MYAFDKETVYNIKYEGNTVLFFKVHHLLMNPSLNHCMSRGSFQVHDLILEQNQKQY